MIDKFGLVAGLEALESTSPSAFAALKESGRSSLNSTNCPDPIFLASFPGMGGSPSPIVTGWGSWGMDTLGGSTIGGRWIVLGSGNTPTTGGFPGMGGSPSPMVTG